MPTDRPSPESKSQVPVVAVGTSAGGIQALKSLLPALPSEPGYALVIIQHKSPQSDESLPRLLEKMTDLPVSTIEDGAEIEPNKIYLNPGHAYVDIDDDSFSITRPESDKPLYLPIDHFFESLADSRKNTTTGIILSGTGTDGSLGLKKIKYQGGITIIQEPETAEYPDMPKNAQQMFQVDFVLSPEEIPAKLDELTNKPYLLEKRIEEGSSEFPQERVQDILELVYDETGHDLRGYKHKPINRRLDRQIALHQMSDLDGLYQHLRDHPERIPEFFRDLTIDYTQFFRDREVFETLDQAILPDILENQPTDRPFRVWIPGCSTGEEVYSLVILLKEVMDRTDKHLKLKVFATDLDSRVINIAREGFYPKRISGDVDQELLDKYFIREGGGFRVKPTVREGVIFAEHNLLQDPPYSNIDFLSCRNLLIYLDKKHQNRALDVMHYSLRTDGLLILGPTETTEQHTELFTSLDPENKIFRKKAETGDINQPVLKFKNLSTKEPSQTSEPESPSPGIIHQAEQRLIHEYGPPAVLLEESHEVRHFFGNTDPWLTYPEGAMNYNIVEMVKDFIEHELIALLNEVSSDNRTVSSEEIVKIGGEVKTVQLVIETLQQSESDPPYHLVIFRQKTPPPSELTMDSDTDDTIRSHGEESEQELREELESTRAYLHKTIERLESKNKELRIKNRELQSLNEEYQSTNEELETSKEELQSTNEELMTVNEKLEEKVDRLDEMNSDMKNLLRATELPVLFLDRDLNIKRFTPTAKEIFNLIESDQGRSVADITSKLKNANLVEEARTVLETLEHRKYEAVSTDGKRYHVKIIPYRSPKDSIEGVVVTFYNVTELREAEENVRVLAEVLKNSNDAIVVTDPDGIILEWNNGAKKLYGYSEGEALGMNLKEMVPDNKTGEMEDVIENIFDGKSIHSERKKFRRTERSWTSGSRPAGYTMNTTV